jgi:hypothetical protein
MLQKFLLALAGGPIRTYLVDDPYVVVRNLDSFYNGTDECSASQPIRVRKAVGHAGGKLSHPSDYQSQRPSLFFFVHASLKVGLQPRQAFLGGANSRFKLSLLQ